jgi:ATP-dependent RNA helicase RhlE
MCHTTKDHSLKFAELYLHPLLEAAIEKSKFTECTPVQAATIPHVLAGKDVAGLAQTGTGKTAAFLLPLMDRVLRSQAADASINMRSATSDSNGDVKAPEEVSTAAESSDPAASSKDPSDLSGRVFRDWHNRHFVLILVPTRELAEQVYENINSLKGEANLRAVSIYGGVSYDKQKSALKEGVEFIVATPGRLLDLYKENLVDLKAVRAIVFDEADRMFDMGFKDDMKYILARVPKERQFLVFSATLNLDVMNTAYQYGANPIDIDVSRDQAKAENVVDKIFHIGGEDKPAQLLSLINKFKPKQIIIFSNFKMNVPRISQFLNDNGHPSVGISSLITQVQRNRVMTQFKSDNDQNILVATDVAARGLDIKGVDMVINYELPDDPENYVHRIGRTGRAGASGLALKRVEDYLRHKVDVAWLEDTDMVKDFKQMASDRPQRSFPSGDFRKGPPSRGGAPAAGGSGRERFSRRPSGDRSSQGDRPPRSSGGDRPYLDDRPARPAAGGGSAQGDRRPRPQQNSDRGPRQGANDRGPREGQTRDNQSRDGGPRQARNQGGHPPRNGGPRSDSRGPRPQPSRPQAGAASKPRTPTAKSKTQQPASIGQKVSGFFKKIFGA